MSAEQTPASTPPPKKEKERGTCGTCRFNENNRCHRFPPVIYMYHTQRQFPFVEQTDWCGEFRK